MRPPPLWKLKRELKRIGSAVWRLIRGIFLEPPRQWFYDLMTTKKQRKINGCAELGSRVAIFVLFQPKGLMQSVQLTLDHLIAEGWSIVVVSNAPLDNRDSALVTNRAAILIVRPNIGYDFGGYRAGLRLLADIGHQPERLILMNDSVWFPLREDNETLRKIESLGAAMAGHIFKTEDKKGHDHLESHLLMLSSEALRHPAWVRFWDRFVMSDDRVTTIRRGEKGLSQALIAAGLNVEGLIDRDKFLNILRDLDDISLRRVMANIVHHRSDAQALCEALSRNDMWREDFLEWVAGALKNSRQHLISTTFIAAAMELCDMGFVKKTRDIRFHLARQKILYLETCSHITPLHPWVKAEIVKEMDKECTPKD